MLATRRDFARTAAGTLAALAGLPYLRAARKVPIALQLYSLRNECKADLPGTLAAIGKLGFEGVEWFGWGGYFDRGPKELRKLMDDAGLKTASDHIHATALQGDNFERTVELYRTLGTKIVTLSELLGSRAARATPQFWEDGAKLMNELAEKLRPHGIRLALHNHTVEFEKLPDGRVPWEIVFDHTSKDVAQQLDLGSARAAGVDPADYIKRYPGRTVAMHMKDWAQDKPKLLLGEGSIEWNRIFDLAETAGGVEWYIVEQETYPYPPMESVARSFENLKKLLAARSV